MWGRDRSGTAGLIDSVRPYARRIAEDEELREHTQKAFRAGRQAQSRLSAPSGTLGIAQRIAQDEELQEKLKTAASELREARDRLQAKPSHRGRNVVLLIVLGVAALFNPITGEKTRRWVSGLFGGGDSSFDSFSSNGSTAPADRGATSTIEESVEVEVPVRTAYNQWTQFEEFPQFMEGVDSVKQLDDTHVHWKASIAGKTHEWDAEITDQQPDERVAWRATDGKANAGVVTFQSLGAERTKVTVRMDYEAEGLAESLGSAVGADSRRVENDLKRFKELIESRGRESGAWRGEVEGGRADS